MSKNDGKVSNEVTTFCIAITHAVKEGAIVHPTQTLFLTKISAKNNIQLLCFSKSIENWKI